MAGWVDEWMSELRLFHVALRFHWGTSSLRRLFSQLLLLWAATYLGIFSFELPPNYFFCSFCNPVQAVSSRSKHSAFATSSCNSAKHKSSTMVENHMENYLSRSCYNSFSNLQLQSRVRFASPSRADAFCPSRLQTCILSGSSHHIDQPSCFRNLTRPCTNCPSVLFRFS